MFRILGCLAPQGVILLWWILLFRNPYDVEPSGRTTFIGGIMIALAGLGSMAAWLRKPMLMYLVFVLSFLPVGLSLSLSPGIFKWIGLLQLVYLVSGIGLHRELRREH